MPTRLLFQSLVRSPLKTILTFVLLGVTAFFFVFNLSTYVSQQKTAKEVEDGTIGVLTAENVPPQMMMNPLYGYFPVTDPTNPVTPKGQITYENVHQQPFSGSEEAALASLPYVTSADRRYMTAGVSE